MLVVVRIYLTLPLKKVKEEAFPIDNGDETRQKDGKPTHRHQKTNRYKQTDRQTDNERTIHSNLNEVTGSLRDVTIMAKEKLFGQE